MQLVKNNQIVQDNWRTLNDDEALPMAGNIIVSITRWLGERSSLIGHSGRLGIQITGGDEVEIIAEELEHFALVTLEFAAFVDGRNYSNARLLRERYGYAGEIRATGEVLRDQMFYLSRCGVNSFLVEDDCDVPNLLLGLDDFSLVYQYAVDDSVPAYRRRSSQM